MERGLIAERTQMGMNQLKATHRKFTQSIYGWDVDKTGALIPNWNEQNAIDYMDWQVNANGMSAASVGRSLNSRGVKGKRGGQWQGQSVKRTIGHTFHANRVDFPFPSKWGTMPWHRK